MSSSNETLLPEQKVSEVFEVEAQGLAHGGSFVTIVKGPAGSTRLGKKVFVRGLIPGEKAEVSLLEETERFAEAQLVKVIGQPASSRVLPPCSLYETCGGCDLQHMNLGAQREAKRQMVEQTLKIQGGVIPTKGVELIGQDLPGFNYRKRIVLHIDRSGVVGFFKRSTKTIVPINQCLITDQAVNRELARVLPVLAENPGIKGDLIIENHDQQVFVVIKILQRYFEDRPVTVPEPLLAELKVGFANVKLYHSKRVIMHQINFKEQGKEDAQSAAVGHFSQVNDQANEVLTRAVLELCQGPHLTELYAGAGNFTLPLARAKKLVDAVEASRELVAMGRERARAEKLEAQITFYRESCESFCKHGVLRTSVLLDPPRSGAPAVIKRLLESPQVKEIVYVSCYLPTLCRDLKDLVAAGFRVEETRVIDMFAQTQHVETVTRLLR